MLASDPKIVQSNSSDEDLAWDVMISAVTHYSSISEAFSDLVRREHDRRGYGKSPTLNTVGLVLEACENEGIFGLSG